MTQNWLELLGDIQENETVDGPHVVREVALHQFKILCSFENEQQAKMCLKQWREQYDDYFSNPENYKSNTNQEEANMTLGQFIDNLHLVANEVPSDTRIVSINRMGREGKDKLDDFIEIKFVDGQSVEIDDYAVIFKKWKQP
jgi:hypothetical protein